MNLTFYGHIAYNSHCCLQIGDIAQLGERLNGIQEVRGSNPLISTKIIHSSKIFPQDIHRTFTAQEVIREKVSASPPKTVLISDESLS